MYNIDNLIIRRPIWQLSNALEEICRVVKLIERNISEEQKKLDKWIEQPDTQVNEYDIDREWDFYHQTMVRISNNALFCQMFIEFELYMINLMDIHNKLKREKGNEENGKLNSIKNYNEPRDKGSTYDKFLIFVTKELNIPDYEKIVHWDKIVNYKDLRNRMVHSAAKYSSLSNTKNKKYSKLKDIVDEDARFQIESFLLPIQDEIREVVKGCFYVKDISLFFEIKELMLKSAEYTVDHISQQLVS